MGDERGSTDQVTVVLLAAASGGVDALAFTTLGHVFAGVMTGNLALLGIAVGPYARRTSGRRCWRSPGSPPATSAPGGCAVPDPGPAGCRPAWAARWRCWPWRRGCGPPAAGRPGVRRAGCCWCWRRWRWASSPGPCSRRARRCGRRRI
ncbi:protein of unknown function [Streptantibioticus cattleyicolor NRRL 8057 = DSM 46488]|nr:protein of unknown function [Streptantibioticus cattleyicolor NRRL 8057 = DSM 46488]